MKLSTPPPPGCVRDHHHHLFFFSSNISNKKLCYSFSVSVSQILQWQARRRWVCADMFPLKCSHLTSCGLISCQGIKSTAESVSDTHGVVLLPCVRAVVFSQLSSLFINSFNTFNTCWPNKLSDVVVLRWDLKKGSRLERPGIMELTLAANENVWSSLDYDWVRGRERSRWCRTSHKPHVRIGHAVL